MLRRRNVAEIKRVRKPGKIRRVQRTPDHKSFVRQPARRFEKEQIEEILAVMCVRTEIGKVARVAGIRRNGTVNIGIDTAIQRRDIPRIQPALQFR